MDEIISRNHQNPINFSQQRCINSETDVGVNGGLKNAELSGVWLAGWHTRLCLNL